MITQFETSDTDLLPLSPFSFSFSLLSPNVYLNKSRIQRRATRSSTARIRYESYRLIGEIESELQPGTGDTQQNQTSRNERPWTSASRRNGLTAAAAAEPMLGLEKSFDVLVNRSLTSVCDSRFLNLSSQHWERQTASLVHYFLACLRLTYRNSDGHAEQRWSIDKTQERYLEEKRRCARVRCWLNSSPQSIIDATSIDNERRM